ncbi:MAG: LptA/OstA family protein [Nitrospirota bacterium]
MMSKLYSTSKLCCLGFFTIVFLALTASAFSQPAAEKIEGPIIITSKTLTTDNKTNTAIFEGSVVARTTDLTMYAVRMIVQYDKITGKVKQIDAQGDVKLIKENRIITSADATYYANEEKVVFTGAPRAVEGENVVTGKKMIYLMNDDRYIVEDSKVFLTKKKVNK